MTDKNRIFNYARQLGFKEAKFAKAEPLLKEINDLDEWLSGGYHASMEYLANNREKRLDVRNILPEAKTVIVFSHIYRTPYKHEEGENKGKISRYAWGSDYHDVLGEKAKKMAAFINDNFPGSKSMHYVDTGPVMEKAWAVRAGLGWKGKNSLILNKEYGSFFFLAVILTSLEIEADAPVDEHCGSCTKCIDACPTDAIFEPRKVDSNRCISYWTIEVKPDKDIPQEIAQNLGGFIFGCDICQDVCPWNRKRSEYTDDEQFFPRKNIISLDLKEVENMTPEIFNEKFRKNPIKRTKLAGLKRNAAAMLKFRNQ